MRSRAKRASARARGARGGCPHGHFGAPLRSVHRFKHRGNARQLRAGISARISANPAALAGGWVRHTAQPNAGQSPPPTPQSPPAPLAASGGRSRLGPRPPTAPPFSPPRARRASPRGARAAGRHADLGAAVGARQALVHPGPPRQGLDRAALRAARRRARAGASPMEGLWRAAGLQRGAATRCAERRGSCAEAAAPTTDNPNSGGWAKRACRQCARAVARLACCSALFGRVIAPEACADMSAASLRALAATERARPARVVHAHAPCGQGDCEGAPPVGPRRRRRHGRVRDCR